MFCKINNKYYVKVSNFYQEVEVKNDNIVPTQGEAKRLYSPVSECEEVSVEEILNASKRKAEPILKETLKKDKKENKKIF